MSSALYSSLLVLLMTVHVTGDRQYASEGNNQQGIIQHDKILPAPTRDPTSPRYLTSGTYGSLFTTMSDLQKIASSGLFDELFTISSTAHNVEFSADCLVTNNYQTQSCRNPSSQGQRSNNCCRTEMRFTAPMTVTSVYTGQSHNVVHGVNSYQFLQVAYCAGPTQCNNGGQCRLEYKIETVLMEIDGQQVFHPVMVPSRCSCRHS